MADTASLSYLLTTPGNTCYSSEAPAPAAYRVLLGQPIPFICTLYTRREMFAQGHALITEDGVLATDRVYNDANQAHVLR